MARSPPDWGPEDGSAQAIRIEMLSWRKKAMPISQ